MKKIYWWLLFIPLLLACAVPIAFSVSTATPTSIVPDKKQGVTAIFPENPTDGAYQRPKSVFGCWNIREKPSVNSEILSVQCDGTLVYFEYVGNGFFRVEGGYICNRAFGMEGRCQ